MLSCSCRDSLQGSESPQPLGASLTQRGWPTGAEHISIHKESLPKTRLLWGAEQSPQAHPHFHPTELCEQTSTASPEGRTCLAGLILLSLALVSIISSLGFSGISHYLPYCERSSNTEEVFSFPLEFLSWTLSHSQAELSISSPKSSPLRAGNLEMLKVRRFKVHWQSSISPACIILGAGQCYQSLAKKE